MCNNNMNYIPLNVNSRSPGIDNPFKTEINRHSKIVTWFLVAEVINFNFIIRFTWKYQPFFMNKSRSLQ